MTITSNSLEAYREIVQPTLQTRQREVFEVIKKNPEGITGYEVAQILGMFPNQISGRFGEGLIILNGFKKLNHGRTNHGIWILTEKGKQFNN